MIPLKDSKGSGHFPFFTILLIALNLIAFYYEFTAANLDVIFENYALIPSLVDLGDPSTWLPFITSQFLHGGLLHIISNMLFLWVFGDNVEEAFGPWFVPVYLASGIAGGLAQYLIAPGSDIPIVGASGAIAGILGAYLVLFPHHTVKTLVPIFGFFTIMDIPATIMLGYWILTQVLSGVGSLSVAAGSGGVAYLAHVGGFAFGWLVATFFRQSLANKR